MAKRIIWKMPDGTIRVTIPVDASKTLDEIAEITRRKNPSLRGAVRLADRDEIELPARNYREAWRANLDGTLRVDATERAKIAAERAKPTMEERIAALEAKRI